MEKIRELLDNFSGEIYDLCFEILKNFGDDSKVFEYVCKNFTHPPENETVVITKHFSKSEIDEFESIYGDTINALLNSTIKKCNLNLIPKEDFYTSLWSVLSANFPGEKEKAFAFYYTLIDATIPYQYLGKPISMSNERFEEIVEKNEANIDKVKYIVKCGYTQRTERASLLLNCLDQIEDFESRTVVLAQAILLFNKPSSVSRFDLDALMKQIDKKIEELEAQEAAEKEKLEEP